MAEIFPFAAYRYNAQKVAPENVLTQPYDKISRRNAEELLRREPLQFNCSRKRTSFPDDTPANNVYTRAPRIRSKNGFRKHPASRLRPIHLRLFAGIRGPRKCAPAASAMALSRWAAWRIMTRRIVFRHEHTLSAPKADRIELLRNTRAQTGQLFMLYDDPSARADDIAAQKSRKPAPHRIARRIWRDPSPLARFRSRHHSPDS